MEITRRGLLAGLAALPAIKALAPIADLFPVVPDVQTYGTSNQEVLTVEMIQSVVEKVKSMPYPINPLRHNGQEYYILFDPCDKPVGYRLVPVRWYG